MNQRDAPDSVVSILLKATEYGPDNLKENSECKNRGKSAAEA
jgi:hypothetical protein